MEHFLREIFEKVCPINFDRIKHVIPHTSGSISSPLCFLPAIQQCCTSLGLFLRDHKPVDDHEKKLIEAKGGEVVFNCGAWRVNGVLTVSRALGSVRSCQKYLSTIPDINVRKVFVSRGPLTEWKATLPCAEVGWDQLKMSCQPPPPANSDSDRTANTHHIKPWYQGGWDMCWYQGWYIYWYQESTHRGP